MSEANIYKKLNEKQKGYEDALIKLEIKCIESYFSRKLINNTFNVLDNIDKICFIQRLLLKLTPIHL